MILLVCGGREYRDRAHVFDTLDLIHAKRGIGLLVHGACTKGGADILAELWAKAREVPYLGHPARWRIDGKAGGGRRNQAMLDRWKPEGVLAFPGGSGTADMIRRAELAGLKVWEPGEKKDA
jgi:hypothetical protein